MASSINFLSVSEKDAVVSAIRAAEATTSGEIRIHIDDRCDEEVLDRAVKVFHHLRMDKTVFRNGVLIYIAVRDRQFAVIGDEAIHKKVDDDFWKDISHQLHNSFKNEQAFQGILNAIETIGKTLSTYFPDIDKLDRNELPDDISYE